MLLVSPYILDKVIRSIAIVVDTETEVVLGRKVARTAVDLNNKKVPISYLKIKLLFIIEPLTD